MKTMQLTIGERLSLINVINQGGTGLTLSAMKDALEIIKKISIEEEEKSLVGFEATEQQISWKDTEYSVKVEVTDDELKMLKEMLDKRDKEAKYNLAEGMNMLSMVEKIEKIK